MEWRMKLPCTSILLLSGVVQTFQKLVIIMYLVFACSLEMHVTFDLSKMDL